MAKLPFIKYTALGNDYILVEEHHGRLLNANDIRKICDRKFGLGADGILLSDTEKKFVTIYNSDGSEAPKSGNGLRIFAYHLLREEVVRQGSFVISCNAGDHEVIASDYLININMGYIKRIYDPSSSSWRPYQDFLELPVGILEVPGRKFEFVAVDIGNPHCVILDAKESDLLTYGKHIESHSYFKDRTNVQFLYKCADNVLDIGVWERGSGHTLASGSSSTAAFAVANELGYCGNKATVRMEGGSLDFCLDSNGIWMEGKVELVADGNIYLESNPHPGVATDA